MEAANGTTHYNERRNTIATKLKDEWYSASDVQKVSNV